jgi:Ca2+:H+ antiporter
MILPYRFLRARLTKEYSIGSVVEIILFMVLISRVDEAAVAQGGINYIEVIKAAILGSILATMLLCLGLCFIVGGIRRDEQTFSESVSEAGSGLLLTASVFSLPQDHRLC